MIDGFFSSVQKLVADDQLHVDASVDSRTSVIQSVGMLFFREDFEPRRPSKTQEVLMESDGVVFIDGSLIEHGAL